MALFMRPGFSVIPLLVYGPITFGHTLLAYGTGSQYAGDSGSGSWGPGMIGVALGSNVSGGATINALVRSNPPFFTAAAPLLPAPANSVAETTVATVTIPGGELFDGGASHSIALDGYYHIQNSYTGAITVTWRLYYGSAVAAVAHSFINSGSYVWGIRLQGGIFSYGNGNQSITVTEMHAGQDFGGTFSGEALGTVDSTQSQIAKVTVQLSVATTQFMVRNLWTKLG
jgi:hypothetical protein